MNAGDVFLLKKLPIIDEGCWVHTNFPPFEGAVTIHDRGSDVTYTANRNLHGHNVHRILLHFVNSPQTVPQGGRHQDYSQCFR